MDVVPPFIHNIFTDIMLRVIPQWQVAKIQIELKFQIVSPHHDLI